MRRKRNVRKQKETGALSSKRKREVEVNRLHFCDLISVLLPQLEEKRLKRELAQKEEEVSLQEEKYANIQQEVEVKTKKLKKLWNKIQQAKVDIQDGQELIQKEKEDILDNIRELSKSLKLKMLVINRCDTRRGSPLSARLTSALLLFSSDSPPYFSFLLLWCLLICAFCFLSVVVVLFLLRIFHVSNDVPSGVMRMVTG